ncbi:DUF4864 domain-containing protein [Nitratireductor kimnyeongensis]|uniref:DUF4864 domain-containing protein n=1 Tax=Nitratireductor kimnyeongensis TaxID=430679 RepID=A0ABW0TBN4_9HYPH|nr:DUF4864 domain-containing protein [Nitratireductor kimnyeongensis]QZZ35549.1 DUF4864 domain-containing protein [Nitratireductor kimnyeongensis]
MKNFLPTLTLTLLSPAFVFAGEAEIRATQSSIRSQIEALQAGEYGLAYSYAAPNIRELFPTVEQFTDTVTRGYQPVYRPRSFAFGRAIEPDATTVVQRVLATGPNGNSYEAVYTLQRQPDGIYRISAVRLREARDLAI